MTRYIVQSGDTLYTIAQRFGISVQTLARINSIINLGQIYVGKELIIPDEATKQGFQSQPQKNNWEMVRRIFGQEGTMTGDVFKVTFLRYDLKVNIDGLDIEPDFALTSWVAFEAKGDHSTMMGDLVLLENEIEPVISSLISSNIKITALHNHLLRELPRVMFLHVEGEGNPIELAQGIKTALLLTKTPLTISEPKVMPQVDWSVVEGILGKVGNHKGSVLQLSFPRTDTISENGIQIPTAMGVAQAVNFQSQDTNVATTGDFVLLENEVNPVMRILRENGITITALHNHMLREVPRLFYMHFWAVDNPERLAHTIKNALEIAKKTTK